MRGFELHDGNRLKALAIPGERGQEMTDAMRAGLISPASTTAPRSRGGGRVTVYSGLLQGTAKLPIPRDPPPARWGHRRRALTSGDLTVVDAIDVFRPGAASAACAPA